MNGKFYNEQWTYDENYEKGPVDLENVQKPHIATTTPLYTFLGFPVTIPFGIPAGPLLNSTFIKAAFDFGFAVSHYKTQRSVAFPCNEFPNVLFVDVDGNLTPEIANEGLIGKTISKKDPKKYSITNSFGNPSRGPEVWQEDMKKALSHEKPRDLLIASVVGTIKEGFNNDEYYNDFAETALLAKETGVKVIEVNLSCPNVANEGVLCYTPGAVEAICRKTKEKIGNTKLVAKLGYFTIDQQELLETIVKKMTPFVSAIAAINTISTPVRDEHGHQALPGPNRLISGICGKCIQWAGIDMVKRLQTIKERNSFDYEIVGVGGVMTPDDFFMYRSAGANLVQSATGAMWNPYLAKEISDKIHTV